MRTHWLSTVSLAALLTWTGTALAASIGPTPTDWLGGSGSWITGSWSNGVPTTGQTVFLTGTGPQNVTFDDTSNPTFASLTVDDPSSTDTGMQLVSSNSFGTSGGMTVGAAGLGQFQQTGGTTSFGLLTVGSQQGSGGIVNLNGGVMNDDAVIGDAGTGTYNNAGGTHNVSGNLILGNQSSGNGTYTLTSGGTLSVTGNATIGEAGTGSYTQGLADQSDAGSGNNATINGNLTLGDQVFSSGTATVNNGTLGVGGAIIVGNFGLGTVNQTGGTVTGGSMTLGNGGSNVEPVDTYTLTGTGALTITGNETVGELGNGAFVQGTGTDNPTHVVGGTLIVGDGAIVVPDPNSPADGNGSGPGPVTPNPREGNFTLNSGSLQAGTMIVANQGIGSFTQNGGSVTVQNQLAIAAQATTPSPDGSGNLVGGPSQGTYSLAGGSLTTGGGLTVGDAGNGALNQTGGTLQVASSDGPNADLTVGNQAGSTGSYSLSRGGSATVNGNLIIGSSGAFSGNPAAVGTVTIGTAGATSDTTNLTVTDTIVVGSGGTGSLTQYSGTVAAGNVAIGGGGGVDGGGVYLDGGTGTYSLGGGSLTTSLLEVGHAGTGTFNQTGGSVNATYSLWIGNAGGSNGTYNLSNGTLNAGSGGEQVGLFGSGAFNQSGGSNLDANALTVGGGGGTYTLTGGALTTGMTGGNPLGDVIIGYNGTGELDNSGGVQTSSSADGFTLGWNGTGTYKLTGTGSLNVAGNENVGVFGQGVFQQGDGAGTTSNIVGGSLYISSGAGGPASSYTLSDGTLNVGGDAVVGFASTGSFTQSGGTNTVGGNLTLGLMSGSNGTYTMSGGTLNVSGDAAIGSAGIGAFIESAGSATVVGTMTIGGTGSATLTGGTLAAGAIVNNNSLTLSQGRVTAPITNNASVTTASGNSVSVTGAATNNGTWSVSGGSTLNQSGGFTNNSGGTLSVTDSTATFGGGAAANNAGATIQVIGSAITFAGGLTNNGAYISDPSTNTFTSLTIGSTGYISASAGDSYVITGPGGFVNNSTDTAHWTTMGATLEYAGTGSQTLGLNASNGDGLNNIFDNSFGWKTLALDSGSFVNLVGGSVISDNAFYVDSLTGLTFSGLDVTNVEGNGYDIFYLASADPTLDGLTYDLADGGFLIPIGAVVPPQNAPEPGALTLLASALAGLGWFRRRLPGSKL